MSAVREAGVLGPIVALNIWTFIIEGWMYSKRIPAIEKYKVTIDPTVTKEQFANKFPPHIRWIADNYNHLMEQPTQFYAIALAVALLHERRGSSADVAMAWAYVGLRVLHSLVQCSTNQIMRRFSIFVTSSAVLLGMTLNAARLAF
ncbi:hypothetical protein PAAG_00628 [Paracoccidioides lutzii Pb01]|uniref:MAPEG family protein n=1 Tax=Paracoccidioides lutzii (strain ATCC MYA-826 / Pb01) TaxID=502779 RepID=C1GQ33_PARBA|nr:hypothetical protein PAAG_00628 [Paracoccidioides lutzii Pb01]EEH36305.1 hypothetical protein PAAG_00628 [Paracoccidioides lutzii Pb01]